MLLQEFGFDIVSILSLTGWLFKGAIVAVLAVLTLYIVRRALSHRRSSRP